MVLVDRDSVALGLATCVPIVDFGPFLDGTRKPEVAAEVFQAMKDVGFVYLVNHGMPQEKIDTMFHWSKKFFDLPLETKNLAPHPPSGKHHRGYSGLGMEKVLKSYEEGQGPDRSTPAPPDLKENFECGNEDSESMPNIWLPEGVLPGFKEACLGFFWDCNQLQLKILRAIAVGLGTEEGYFDATQTAHDHQLRLLHYPPTSRKAVQEGQTVRIGAHADYGSITLLFQDDVGGLEVEDPKVPGVFQSIPPVEGAVMVNAGDFLMRWSNDIIKSAVHRVRVPPSNAATDDRIIPSRYSIPYFCVPDLNTVVDCIPGTWSDERPKRYKPISAMGYIMERLAANYE